MAAAAENELQQDLKTKILLTSEKVKTWKSRTYTADKPNNLSHFLHSAIDALMILKTHLSGQGDISLVTQCLPETIELLSALRSIPVLNSYPRLHQLLLECTLLLYKDAPSTDLEVRAKKWCLMQIKLAAVQSKSLNSICGQLTVDCQHGYKVAIARILEGIKAQLTSVAANAGPCDCDAVDVHGLLETVADMLLLAPHLPVLSDLWEQVLAICLQLEGTERDDGHVMLLYRRITDTQKEAYVRAKMGTISPAVAERCATQDGQDQKAYQYVYGYVFVEVDCSLSLRSMSLLWLSYRPALEQELLQLVKAVTSQSLLPSQVFSKIKSRHLITICSESPVLYELVQNILWSLLVQSKGSSQIAQVMWMLHVAYVEQPSPGNGPDSSVECKTLIAIQNTRITDLTCDSFLCHIRCIVRIHTEWMQGSPSQEEWLTMSKYRLRLHSWYLKLLSVVLLCDRQEVPLCVEGLVMFCQLDSSTVETTQRQVGSLICSLRPLVMKSSLAAQDVQYAVSSQCEDGMSPQIVGQILTIFLLVSRGGLHLATVLLKLATGSDVIEDHLWALLETVQHMNLVNPSLCKSNWTEIKQTVAKLKSQLEIKLREAPGLVEQPSQDIELIKQRIECAKEFLLSDKG